jgi:ElaA protein
MMQLNWVQKPFAVLSGAEVYRVMAARAAVFVMEQQCLYLDADFADQQCVHLFAQASDGELAAYARLVPPGLKFAEPSIGRVLTTEIARGKKLARPLMQRAIQACYELYGVQPIRIGAQHYLEGFYQSLGFLTVSEVYDEDGIAHIQMRTP